MDKRGISPLIATVLIIGFTVSLAAIILIWGQGLQKGMTDNVEMSACIDSKLLQSEYDPDFFVCSNSTGVNESCVKETAWRLCNE